MSVISRPYILMWTIVGLLLTIGANFMPAYIINSPWQWLNGGVTAHPLGFKCQVGAVLLVSCLGGRTTGVLTQIAYICLGLTWLKIFNDGGGIEYIYKPMFGYLLAFIPAAWVCGKLAFARAPQLEHLGLSCLCGIVTIHTIGLLYLCLYSVVTAGTGTFDLLQAMLDYSVYPAIGQLVLACTASSIAFVVRKVMLY